MNTKPNADTERVCYLHFGPHKTGSTSIQAMLNRRVKAIKRAGVHVATFKTVADGEKGNHSHLGTKAHFENYSSLDKSPDWNLISKDIVNQTQPVAISGEKIYKRITEKESYDKIVDFFLSRGFKLVLIAYVRDQVGWINSHYAQHLKNFQSAIAFRRYVKKALEEREFEFDQMLAHPLADDRVSLQVVSFETAIKIGLEQDFLRRIGAEAVDFEPQRIANPNFGAKGAYVARSILRSRGQDLQGKPGLRKSLDQALRRTALKRGWSETPYMGFDAQAARSIREHFRSSNDEFSRRFFDKSWDEIAPPKTVVRSVFAPRLATAAERAEIRKVSNMLSKMIDARIETDG